MTRPSFRILSLVALGPYLACGGEQLPRTPSAAGSAPGAEIPGPAIDRVVFDLKAAFGAGGLYYVTAPLLLFQGGVACDCLDEDLVGLDIDELQQRRPNAVGAWREQDGRVRVKWGEEWSNVAFRAPASPLGDGWREEGRFHRNDLLTDETTGTVVVAAKDLRLSRDGRFALGSLAGVSSPNWSAKTEAELAGEYALAGWVMTLRFDDGHVERFSAVTGSDEPGSVLSIAGSAYTRVR